MATTTVTLSSVSCSIHTNYRRDEITGELTTNGSWLVCPTAINVPVFLSSYTYTLVVTGTNSESSTTYDITGSSGTSDEGYTVGFTS